MKPKQMLLFGVAIGCGLVAMMLAQQVLSGNRSEPEEKVRILVAKTDIEPGVALDKTLVDFKEWPKDAIPEGALTKEEEYTERALKSRISVGMPILTPLLSAKGAFGPNSMIPDGMQVVSLPPDAQMTHGGLLRAGSYVCVTCVIDQQGRNGQPPRPMIRTVLKRVKVFAVGNVVSGTDGASKDGAAVDVKSISLVVWPNQAKLLQHARALSNQRINIAMLGQEAIKQADDGKDFDEDSYRLAANELAGVGEPEPTQEKGSALAPVVQNQNSPAPEIGQIPPTFSDYVKKQPVAAEIADLGKGPTRKKWTIEIRNGDKPTIHELDLPHDEPEQPSVENIAPSTNIQWAAPLMKFFNSRRKVENPSDREAQETSTGSEQTVGATDKSAATPADTIRK
jgi:pilus assembly protein CpaB